MQLGCISTREVHKSNGYDYDKNKFDWYLKSYQLDSLPGIELIRAQNFLQAKKRYTVVVAVIDTELNISHPDLEDQIWTNHDEIPDNGIDDDNNGYVDDIHGWNFVGTNKDDDIPYSNYEYVRIIKKYRLEHKSATEKELYDKAFLAYNHELNKRKKRIERYEDIRSNYIKSSNLVEKLLSSTSYSMEDIDSLRRTLVNENDKKSIDTLLYYKKYNVDNEWINNRIEFENFKINTLLNVDHDERNLTNDNPDILDDISYGNNNIQGTHKISHSTKVSSVIAAEINNDIGINGINNRVKIMPLSISVAGDEHDKDIALAIRYAVDNGAKIINMSIGKKFSLHPKWVNEAIKYAEKHDVLVVTSAGNDGSNIDEIDDFPTDNLNGKESVHNFIKVGNTSYRMDSKLVHSTSNYGKKNVDIFAPGTKIECLSRDGKVKDTGTSLSSAVVSGIASLLLSSYPNLSAAEVKQIIMVSGVSYDIMVLKPYANGEKRDPTKVPFSSLSKSGKIVNAYNALLMAEEVSKKKKKRM